jgi:hypothetical protein
MEETEPQEPATCDDCGEDFDAAEPGNWESKPFALVCPHCQHRMYPQRDNYND